MGQIRARKVDGVKAIAQLRADKDCGKHEAALATLKQFPYAQEAVLAHSALERMGKRLSGGVQVDP